MLVRNTRHCVVSFTGGPLGWLACRCWQTSCWWSPPLGPRILMCPERQFPANNARSSLFLISQGFVVSCGLMNGQQANHGEYLALFWCLLSTVCPSGLDPTLESGCQHTVKLYGTAQPGHSFFPKPGCNLVLRVGIVAPSRMADIRKGGLCCSQMTLESGDAVLFLVVLGPSSYMRASHPLMRRHCHQPPFFSSPLLLCR